jgi:hypothetical protein
MPGKSRTVIRFERAETRMIKTIVIGAGVMGASVAYRLAQAGAAVTVLEATRVGGGTSGISFAWTDAQQGRARRVTEAQGPLPPTYAVPSSHRQGPFWGKSGSRWSRLSGRCGFRKRSPANPNFIDQSDTPLLRWVGLRQLWLCLRIRG